MSRHLQAGLMLFQMSRFEPAEKEFRRALADDPNDAEAHLWLARCLLERKNYDEATREAQTAVGLEPDQPEAHYTLALVWYERQYPSAAAESLDEAVRLNPQNASYHGLRSAIHFNGSRWAQALQAAETGLKCDSEHVQCNNLRAMALVKLGRRAEAGATIDATLARDPEDAASHANKGWTLLDGRDAKQALIHFREALRIDPNYEYARLGIVEALKARNPIYGLFLRYMLWMAKLPPQWQWGVILGGYFGNQILRRLRASNPELAPWLTPLIVAYVAFAIFTWLARPIFNLLLRFHPFGRHALSAEERREASIIAGLLAGGIACFSASAATNIEWLGFSALGLAMTTMPVHVYFCCSEGWPRKLMLGVNLAMLGLLAISATMNMLGPTRDPAAGLFLLLWIASIWGGMALTNVTPKR